MTHTPWKFSTSRNGWDCIRDSRGTEILKPATTMNESEMEQAIHAVNCHVELLKALQILHGEFQSRMALVESCDWTPEEDEADELTRAAIAKATGQD